MIDKALWDLGKYLKIRKDNPDIYYMKATLLYKA